MAVPTSQQALDAFAVAEERKLGIAYIRPLGKWVVITEKLTAMKTAGRHEDGWSALLAAETVIANGSALAQLRALPRLIAAAQTGLFTVRPREVAGPEGPVKVFDIIVNGTPTTILGRTSWAGAVVDAIALLGIPV